MSKDPKNEAAPTSPAFEELAIVSNIMGIVGEAGIKAKDCLVAKRLLDWLEAKVAEAQAVVDAEAKAAEAKAEEAKPKLVPAPEAQPEAPASA